MAFVEQPAFLCTASDLKGTDELGLHRPHTTDIIHSAADVFIIFISTHLSSTKNTGTNVQSA